jgi:hypothetical protein
MSPVGVVDDVGQLAVHLEERREHLDGVVGRRARHRPDVEGVGLVPRYSTAPTLMSHSVSELPSNLKRFSFSLWSKILPW